MLKNIWLWWKESGGFHQISLTLELLEGFQWSHYTDLWEKVHTKAENRSSHSPKYTKPLGSTFTLKMEKNNFLAFFTQVEIKRISWTKGRNNGRGYILFMTISVANKIPGMYWASNKHQWNEWMIQHSGLIIWSWLQALIENHLTIDGGKLAFKAL